MQVVILLSMGSAYLWSITDSIQIYEEIHDDIIKICNIDNHIFLLTNKHTLFHGCIEKIDNILQLNLIKYTDHYFLDIDCSESNVYVVELEGKVFKLTEDLKVCCDISLAEEPKCCSHGHTISKNYVKVANIAVGGLGILFITNTGELWASGSMPQIGINCDIPKKVPVFEGRTTLSISVGYDFAIALICKQFKTEDTDSECEDVFVSTCPRCISSTRISSPSSQNSFSDTCPLGISQSVEKSSTTSAPSSSKETESSDSEQSKKYIQYEDDNGGNTADSDKTEKNIIFRNTEAAKEFLTRQFSWVSAGEEYLAECTERPTRIIKENVSNMANLVYEGVKTVGDKVVTLSRHVSGSSDNNDVNESFDFVSISGASSRDDFLISSSQGTSDKEGQEQGLQEKCNIIFKNGAALLNTELWTWGNVSHGQLGIGDTVKRDKPILITKLSNIGVRKVHARSFHSAALTLDGRAFLWGKNDYHQVSVECKVDISAPKLFVTNSGDRINDVSCGDNHTVILTSNNKVYYFGKLSVGSTEKLIHIKIPKTEYYSNSSDFPLQSFIKSRHRNKLSTTCTFTCLNVHPSLENSPLLEDIALEQIFLEELVTAQSTLIKPLQRKNFASPDMNVYETLCRCYNEISYFTALNISSLIEFCNGNTPDTEIIMIKYAEEQLFMFKNYLKIICDVTSLGGFQYISQIIDLPQHLYKLTSQTFSKRDKKAPECLIQWLFSHPLQRLSIYSLICHKLIRRKITRDSRLHDIMKKWDSLNYEQEQKQNEADITRKFWENSGKSVELLKSPERRLIRESKAFPIFLQNAGRFSSHWFILLSDMFIHINGTSSTTHNLTTLWVESQPNVDNGQNLLTLTMPEETMQLYTTEPEQKAEWVQYLQNAIKLNLNKSNANQPPTIRTAFYTFVKHPTYKEAKYTGRWHNGKMHGNGKIEWTDGKLYIGQFQSNQMHGYGRLENPATGIYEGQWRENLQNGKGTMKYTSGDIYEGYFKDGLPHGHGVKKQGHFMASAASLYIGEWVAGTKYGYGVMDDIVTGEKYLGNWLDNKKHGCGLIVTSDGIYYEGVFSQDVLTGHGLMIFEDGTHYEGEFRAAGKFNGKGILTLNSGDKIEGSLSGSWNEGIKISAGTLHLATNKLTTSTKPKSFGKLCVNGNHKWKAIFRMSYQSLGVPEPNSKNNNKVPEIQKIWQNVAVGISNSRQGTLIKGDKKNKKQMQREQLDLIPQFCRERIDPESYKELNTYLMKAFESPHHPLGSLLTDITEAYTTTYGGVRVHPLLLNDAVAELHSIIIRIYDIVKLLFPALPPYEKEVSLDEEDESDIVSCATLLHPILLPRIYSALFILYALHNKQEDCIYWKRLLEWNKQSDFTLMAFLTVDQKFWTCLDTKPAQEQPPFSPVKDQMFTKAVETLQQLKMTFSPFEKLLVIRQTFQKMTSTVQSQLGADYRWTMDDLFPVFHFVVVRARILQLGSEIHFIEDFMEPNLQNGELGIMFTTLKACYYQILQEKSTINS